ncbi:hypothetical protein DL98DRAFT_511131, partial [Cadophora sp. DSE1049]
MFPGHSYIPLYRAFQSLFEKERSLEFRHSCSGQKSLSPYAAPLSNTTQLDTSFAQTQILHPWW